MTILGAAMRILLTLVAMPAHPSPSFYPVGVIFLITPLVVGFVPPALTFALRPHAAEDIGLTAVPVPAWVFITVWLIIYPSMGVAAWHIWQLQSMIDISVPLAVLVAGFLQTMLFWFTNSLRSTAIMDATGVLLAATTLWVLSRSSADAALWLLPWMLWMPITFGIKLAVLADIL